MAIKIDTHVRGIVIQLSGETKRSEIGRRLRARIPRELVLSYSDQFILPLESAHLVAEEFSSDAIVWTQDAWEIAKAQRQLQSRIDAARLEVAEALTCPRQALEGYSLINHLDEHQIEAVAAMTVPSLVGLALFDEQGLGKTIMALCAFDRLRQINQVDYLLVVAPKSVLTSWLNDIKRMFVDRYAVRVVAGSWDTRRRRIRSHSEILLCSYEVVVSDKDLLIRTIRSKQARVLLVVDESYFIKNPYAKRSQALVALRTYCDRTIILCGTPAPNSPKDLINQIDMITPGSLTTTGTIPEDDQETKQLVSQRLQNIIYLRRLKADVFPTIPEKQFERVFINMRPIQSALYKRAYRDLVLAVRGVDEQEFQRNLGSFLARRNALLQICSHPGSIDPLYHEVPAKLLALDKLLQELIIAQRKKVVIWSFYRYSLDAIASRYQHYGLVRIDGSVTQLSKRKEAIKRFQEDKDTRVFLGNAAAAGAGITLTAAHHAIYESFSNQAAHYMQSVDRIHRRGQKYDVTYHILLARHTIEESEFNRILEKEHSGRELLQDRYKEPITKERFLNELGVTKR